MRKSLLFLCNMFLCLTLFAQTGTVTGVVTNSKDGTGIVANILIKGSPNGTASSADGKYSIGNVPAGATLVFSSAGFKEVEAVVRGRNVIHIALDPDEKALDEVIMVAYGTSTKGSYTGAASVINQSQIKDIPTTSFQDALAGKAAGIQVASSSGQAGSNTSIRIRGIGSINASRDPLYVIDGVPVVSGSTGQLSDYIYSTNNVMNSINPADIESITILKDAAASALYGSRAANGVVLITTKKGKAGKAKISFKSTLGLSPSWATDNYEAADIQSQVNMLYRVFHDVNTTGGKTDAVANADAIRRLNLKWNMHGYYFETAGTGLNENVSIKGMTDGMVNREGKYFDWEDAYFRTGIYQSNDVSVSGGDQNTKYYTSLSYLKDQSRVRVNEYDRITGRVNLSQKVGKVLELVSNVNVSKGELTGFNDTRNTGTNYYMQTRNLMWGMYWPTNYKTGADWTARFGSLAQNNLYYDKEWDNSSNTLRLTANQTAQINILPDLNVKSVLSYDNTQTKDHIYYSAKHYSGSVTNGTVTEMTTNINRIVSSTTINYKKNFGLNGITALLGYEAEKSITDFMRSTGKDLPSSALHTVATAGVTEASAYSWGSSMVSIFSRLEYDYNQKYYFSASLRNDGSSRLSPANRYGNFWSVAGAWNISNEDFLNNMNEISNLKLRASYGVNGTLPSSLYAWRNLTGYGTKYMEQAGGGLSGLGNDQLNWESNYSTNIGLDFGLFNQKVYGTIEYFNRDSRDLLLPVSISKVTGFDNVLKNVGEINNKGIELDLGATIISNEKFRWSVGANATFISSKVTQLYKGEGESVGQDIIWLDPTGGDGRAQFIYREGASTLAFYGYEWAGVDPANGKNRWFVNDPNNKDAGDFVVDGRGATYEYKKANYKIIGDGMPKMYGGFNTSLEYSGFTLSGSFIYKVGGKIYDGASKDVADDGYYWERIRSKYYYDNMWTKENPNGTLPKIDGNDLEDAIQYSSRNLYDASFLRLKNVTLSYNLPASLINKAGISNARVYVNGTNLLTFSKYKNADPEVNDYSTRGWEMPFAKTYTFGLEFSF